MTIAVNIESHATVRYENGFQLRIPLDTGARVSFWNATSDTICASLYGVINDHDRFPFQVFSRIEDHDNRMSIAFSNPLHPVNKIVPDGLDLDLMLSPPPYATNMSGLKNIAPILEDGDVIASEFRIVDTNPYPVNEKGGNVVVFSPHPEASEQAITLAFDELPSLAPNWAIPTDAQNPSTPVTSQILSFLDIYPDVKFTLLMLTDGLERYGDWYFKDWYPPKYNELPDSSVVRSGRYSLRYKIDSTSAIKAAAIVKMETVEPGEEYTFGMCVKPVSTDPRGYFTVTVRDWPSSKVLNAEVLHFIQGEWTKYEIKFTNEDKGQSRLTTVILAMNVMSSWMMRFA